MVAPLLGTSQAMPPPPSVWQTHSNFQLAAMVLSIFFWVFSFTAAFSAITISRWRYVPHKRSRSSRLPKDGAPGVSIIRPLRGIDCNMVENLASSFQQDYPRFEVIFSVAQSNDPAIAVVKDLMKQFPKVDARIIIGERNVGINPKINNMIQSYETAKYDILWVLDSNVYVDPGCMGRSVDKMMKPGVGLVHHLPFGVRPQTLGSELELMFLDTVHAKMYLFINWTGLASCVVGKSNLYRRSDLDKVGGLAKFGKYMAEDNLVATAIFNMGYKHEMTSDLAYQSLGSMTPSDYFLRRARWTRIRKYTVTAATVVEPFIEMIGCGLVASFGFNLLWNIHPLNFLAFHVVVWFLVDLSMYQALSGQKIDNLRGFLMAWCLRELAALPLFAYAVVGSTVDWRDQTFMLLRDGTVKALAAAPPSVKISKASSSPRSASSSSLSTPTGSVPSSPLTADFWSKANTVVPLSTQATLRRFFRHPTVVAIVKNTFAVIHFVVDILIKSQRNGNEEEQLDDEELSDDNSHEEPLVKLQRVPLRRSSTNKGLNKKYKASSGTSGPSYDADDSSAAESDAVLRATPTITRTNSTRSKVQSKLQYRRSAESGESDHEEQAQEEDEEEEDDGEEEERMMPVYSNTKSETEAEHGRRSVEEDALSKAVEPYLSDSLSRRGRIRHERPSATHFLNV